MIADMKKHAQFLTDAQLAAEISRCEYCQEKPCKKACPADCSPADFIMAAKRGEKSDFRRAAALILGNNPLGGVCGAVCPDKFCMKACARSGIDSPVNIPAVQATLVQKAKELGVLPLFIKSEPNGRKIAVIGAGPAGVSAAAVLAQKGYKVDIFDSYGAVGGMCNLIPDFRLDKSVLATDLDFIRSLGDINLETDCAVQKPSELLAKGYCAVIAACGLA